MPKNARVKFPKGLNCRKAMKTLSQKLYHTDTTVTTFVESCVALAFLPPSDVETCFEAMVFMLQPRYAGLLCVFNEYFRSTWIKGNFSILMWNKYGHDHRHDSIARFRGLPSLIFDYQLLIHN